MSTVATAIRTARPQTITTGFGIFGPVLIDARKSVISSNCCCRAAAAGRGGLSEWELGAARLALQRRSGAVPAPLQPARYGAAAPAGGAAWCIAAAAAAANSRADRSMDGAFTSSIGRATPIRPTCCSVQRGLGVSALDVLQRDPRFLLACAKALQRPTSPAPAIVSNAEVSTRYERPCGSSPCGHSVSCLP